MDLQAGLYGVPKRQRQTMEILEALGLEDKADIYSVGPAGRAAACWSPRRWCIRRQ